MASVVEDFNYAVTRGAERNLIVLDAHAKTGYLTRRLIGLMKVVQKRTAGSRLTNLVVPMDSFYSLLIEANIDTDKNYVEIFGVNVQGSYKFNFGDPGDPTHFFLSKGGYYLPSGKEELVIGLSEGEKRTEYRYLLGAI